MGAGSRRVLEVDRRVADLEGLVEHRGRCTYRKRHPTVACRSMRGPAPRSEVGTRPDGWLKEPRSEHCRGARGVFVCPGASFGSVPRCGIAGCDHRSAAQPRAAAAPPPVHAPAARRSSYRHPHRGGERSPRKGSGGNCGAGSPSINPRILRKSRKYQVADRPPRAKRASGLSLADAEFSAGSLGTRQDISDSSILARRLAGRAVDSVD